MKTKRIIGCLCAALMLLMPLKAFAVEPEMTGQEEAEELYHQIFGDGEIAPRSDLGTCDVGISSQEGKLLVVYSTACRGIASKIGVKEFTLQQKDAFSGEIFW